MKRTTTIIVTSLLLALPAFGIGQARITLTVVDTDGSPVAGAKLHVTGTDRRGYDETFQTDEKGKVSIVFNDGTVPYRFTLTKEGFAPWDQTFRMQLLPVPNDRKVVLQREAVAAPPSQQEVPATETRTAADAYNEGVSFANAGKNEEAIEKFEEAVKIDPNLTAAYAALTRVHTRLDQWDDVIADGEKALDTGGDDEAVLALVADAYEHKGDKEKADAYRKRIPESAPVIFNKAVPLLNAGKDAEAEPILVQAIERDDSFARAHYELGMLYGRQGKNAEARKQLERYLELDPEGENAEMAKEMLKYLQ